jgi:hypothetical protein
MLISFVPVPYRWWPVLPATGIRAEGRPPGGVLVRSPRPRADVTPPLPGSRRRPAATRSRSCPDAGRTCAWTARNSPATTASAPASVESARACSVRTSRRKSSRASPARSAHSSRSTTSMSSVSCCGCVVPVHRADSHRGLSGEPAARSQRPAGVERAGTVPARHGGCCGTRWPPQPCSASATGSCGSCKSAHRQSRQPFRARDQARRLASGSTQSLHRCSTSSSAS